MIENGLYKLNKKGISFLKANNCQIVKDFNDSKVNSRPMYFAMTSKISNEIVFLIPLTTIRSKEHELKIDSYLLSKGIQSNYFEKALILGEKRAFKISSVFAVDSTMLNEWTIKDSIYVVRNKIVIKSVRNKLNVMLNHYAANPEKSENHVIELRDKLLELARNFG